MWKTSHLDAFVCLFTGGTDVLDWKSVGLVKNYYIGGLNLSLTDQATAQPVYYVSLRSENGVGRIATSTSTPVYIIQGDRAGNVYIITSEQRETKTERETCDRCEPYIYCKLTFLSMFKFVCKFANPLSLPIFFVSNQLFNSIFFDDNL